MHSELWTKAFLAAITGHSSLENATNDEVVKWSTQVADMAVNEYSKRYTEWAEKAGGAA